MNEITLKYIDINGHGVLVDESAEMESKFNNNLPYARLENNEWRVDYKRPHIATLSNYCHKIVFAEKEFNLDVPILPNWREWEVEHLAAKLLDEAFGSIDPIYDEPKSLCRDFFIEGHNHNKKIYTEEDLVKAIAFGFGICRNEDRAPFNLEQIKFIQSLQKKPTSVVVEVEEKSHAEIQKEFGVYGHDEGLTEKEFKEYEKSNSIYKLKLVTNSDGKQTGVIKKIVY